MVQDQVGPDDERGMGRLQRQMLSKNRRWAIPAHHLNIINIIDYYAKTRKTNSSKWNGRFSQIL